MLFGLVLSGQQSCAAAETSHAPFSAVILAYQHIGEDAFPDTNIRLEQFEAHIKELQNGDYNILPLNDIVTSLKEQKTLPANTIALTFDGGYYSVYEHAIPLLLKNDMPFTLFLATDHLEHDSTRYMDWGDLKRLKKNKLVTFGLHPASYTHLVDSPEKEITRQINKAKTRFREKLNLEPLLFAYPFGEYSASYRNIVETSGFQFSFGLQSGVAYDGADMLALPRFTMTESYSSLDRFRLVVNALPLPVTDIKPRDPHLSSNNLAVGFTIDKALIGSLNKLACFTSDQARPHIEIISNNRIELRFEEAFENKRIRINCTMPGPRSEPDETPIWRWFGLLMTTAPETVIQEQLQRLSLQE